LEKSGTARKQGRRRPELLAALDLGTNNCRLLIAARARDGSLRVVDSFSRIVRLGEGVTRTGVLSEAAIERTVAALKICAGRLAKNRVKKLRAVATEACRRAANAELLVRRVADETGIALDIVSAEEEARLAAIGCAPLIGEDYAGALAFDIGGGSTEAIWIERNGGAPKPLHFASVPQGVMSWEDEADDRAAYDAMRAAMTSRFKEVRRQMDAHGPFDAARHHLLGTSGTVTTLAGVAMGLPRYLRSRVDGSWHDCAAILAVGERLVAMGREARARLGCIGEERADLIVAGCAIFAAILIVWPCARLRVADRGLREGILRELMARR
jgi:exopolyphosphatase/guanosine-5'-triphosphate,3'-diphosphate pyrophosphatase